MSSPNNQRRACGNKMKMNSKSFCIKNAEQNDTIPRHVQATLLSYPIFMPKPSTHRMHDPGSIVPHIRPKVFTDNQMS
jgi:hypothetical protein